MTVAAGASSLCSLALDPESLGGGPVGEVAPSFGSRHAREVRAGPLGYSGSDVPAGSGRDSARFPSSGPNLKDRSPPLCSLPPLDLPDLGPVVAGSGAGRVLPELVVLDKPGGNPCWCYQRDGDGALFRRSAPWSHSRGLSSIPRPCFPGESSNPGMGWATAAPGALCPPWRHRLGKFGALGVGSSCSPGRSAPSSLGGRGSGSPSRLQLHRRCQLRPVHMHLGPNLRHVARQLLPFGDSLGDLPSSIGLLRCLRCRWLMCAPPCCWLCSMASRDLSPTDVLLSGERLYTSTVQRLRA